MEKSKLVLYLILVSLLLLVPIIFLVGAFSFIFRIYIYIFDILAMVLLLIGLLYARKDVLSHSARWGWTTARTPIGVGIVMILVGLLGYFTEGFGSAPPGTFSIPPEGVVQAIIITILTLSSVIMALIGAILYQDPRKKQKRQSSFV